MNHTNMVFNHGLKKKRLINKKWRNTEYQVQKTKAFYHQCFKMYCTTDWFSLLSYFGPRNKPHGAHRLGKIIICFLSQNRT